MTERPFTPDQIIDRVKLVRDEFLRAWQLASRDLWLESGEAQGNAMVAVDQLIWDQLGRRA